MSFRKLLMEVVYDVDAWGLWGWCRIAVRRKIIIKMFKFIKIRVMWIYGFNFTRLIFFWNTKAWILYCNGCTTEQIRRRRQRGEGGGGLERQPVWRYIRNGVKGWWHVELFKIFFSIFCTITLFNWNFHYKTIIICVNIHTAFIYPFSLSVYSSSQRNELND